MAASLLWLAYELCFLLQVYLNRYKKYSKFFFLLLVLYFSTMMLNSSQQFFQQIPVLTSANLLAMLSETNRSTPYDPLAEIRNGLNIVLSKNISY